MEAVEALVAKVKSGDMSVVEQMLLSQAVALQGVFTSLTLRAATQTNPRLLQTQLGLALRAQSQARATLEALILLKQPSSPTYIGQANIAGQQQVNNSAPSLTERQYRKNYFNQNELENLDENCLAGCAAQTASSADHGHSTLETVDRAENSNG